MEPGIPGEVWKQAAGDEGQVPARGLQDTNTRQFIEALGAQLNHLSKHSLILQIIAEVLML